MFATGSTHDEIAQATGLSRNTIASRSAREGWAVERAKVESTVAKASQENRELITRTLKQRGSDWQARVATVSEKSLRILEKEEPDTLRGVDKLSTVLEKVDRIARKTFGLDDESAQANTIVNLGFLGEYQPQIASANPPLTATVIA